MTGGLLNPPREDKLSRQLIAATEARMRRMDDKLTSMVMDRDDYHRTIGARLHLAELLKEQQRLYEKETTK